MRAVPEALAEALAAPLSGLAYLWRVQRRDGVALGFTSHDRALLVDGLRYEPAPGMRPFAITETGSAEEDGSEVTGALTSDKLTEAELMAGHYDGARVEMRLVDWTNPDGGTVLLTAGSMGAVSSSGGSFEAELQTPAAQLQRVPVETTSPECRAALGDRRCQVDLSKRRRRVTIASVGTDGRIQVEDALAAGAFAYGRMRFLSGVLAGQDISLLRSGADWVEPSGDFSGAATGDLAELTEGCDKRWATCRDRFQNQANFRGEPFVPGQDSLLRYPGL